MKITGNTVLITGGATGIGFALAEALIKTKNEVIICGRRQDKLEEAKAKLPGLITKKCDITKEGDRKAVYDWIKKDFKEINILINNAGIQRPIDLKKGSEEFLKNDNEIETNLTSQIHLIAQFIPTLLNQKEAAIVNVTSGLAFVPLARTPVYCATKAALHSFTMSLRHQLASTPIKVFELIPPLVHDTELHFGKHLPKNDYSSSSKEVAEALIGGLEKNEYEIAVGAANRMRETSRGDPQKAFKDMNER